MMSTLDRVREVIADVCGNAECGENDLLKEDIGLDSLSLVAVIVALEEAFEVSFDDGDLDPAALLRVGDLVALVERTV